MHAVRSGHYKFSPFCVGKEDHGIGVGEILSKQNMQNVNTKYSPIQEITCRLRVNI